MKRVTLLILGLAFALTAGTVSAASQTNAKDAQDGGNNVINLVEAWDYNKIYANGISVDRLLDADVYDAHSDEMIGEVENLVIGPEGRVTDIIIETGSLFNADVFDIADTHILYPFDKAKIANINKVYVEIREDDLADYSLFPVAVENVLTGPRWKISALLNDYAAVAGMTPYGVVSDVIINKAGDILAVVVSPDIASAYSGSYLWPYYGYEYGFEPGHAYYMVPYTQQQVANLPVFKPEQLSGATTG